MENFITNLFAHPTIALVAVIGACAAWAVTAIAIQSRLARVARLELELKRQMLDKGLSATEIEHVLRISPEAIAEESYHFSGEEDLDKGTLVKLLSDHEYSGADIERILQAYAVPAHAANTVSARIGRAKAVEGMVENERPADQIIQMLHAFHAEPAVNPGFAPDAIQSIRS